MNVSGLKIGMLGAAKIGNWGLVQPCRRVEGVTLHAVAARDRQRADAYAKRYAIPVVHNSYQALLDDPALDAIYNPLPNSLHCEWSLKALDAGKHVLCEKPFASNAREAEAMADAAQRTGRVLMEAVHSRFHPMAQRMKDAVAQLGHIHSITTNMCVPLYSPKDIRYRYDLAGGATMDLGVYALGLLRRLASAAENPGLRKPAEIVSAEPLLRGPAIDRAMKVALRWEDGTQGRVHYSLWSASLINLSAHVAGSNGELRVINPYLPQVWNRFSLRLNGKRSVERIKGESTYTYQLREFVRRIRGDGAYPWDLAESLESMRMIDAVYEKAGLPIRGLPGEGRAVQ
jgi:predicted dehydrogenase